MIKPVELHKNELRKLDRWLEKNDCIYTLCDVKLLCAFVPENFGKDGKI